MKILPWTRPTLLALLLSIFHFSGLSQNNWEDKSDSLRNELSRHTGTKKSDLQLELALHIYQKNNNEARELAQAALDAAKKEGNKELGMRSFFALGKIASAAKEMSLSEAYLDSALALSERIGNNWYKGEILYRIGVNYYRNGEEFQALKYYNQSLSACRLSNNFKTMGSVYSMMGTIFRLNGIYDRAIEYNIRSKLNYEKADFQEGAAWTAYLLGRTYDDLKLHEKALEFFYESLLIYEAMATADGNFNGVALCHEQISLVELKSGNLNEARISAAKVLDIRTAETSEFGISTALSILGRIEYYNKNYLLAEKKLNRSLQLKKEIEDNIGLSVIYKYSGLCAIAQGGIEDGIKKLQQGLTYAKNNKQKKIEKDIHASLSSVFLQRNMHKEAIAHQQKIIEIQEELLAGAANIKIEQLQTFYEIEEKNNQITELKNLNEINSLRIKQQNTYQTFMVIAIIFVVLLCLIILFYTRKINRKNRELATLNKTKDRLFSIIAHDLKGPISAVHELGKILMNEMNKSDQPGFRHSFTLMNQSLGETSDLLSNLLQWAHAQLQGIRYSPETLVLAEVAHETAGHIATQAKKKKIIVTVDIDESIQVVADLNMLKSILRNLISNAVKFTPDEGNVMVYTAQKGQVVHVCVRDNGIGIPTEIRENLFSVNEGNSRSGTSGEKGTGLGLALCKDFVDMHKGKIWVESTPDKGSVFCFSLSLASPGNGESIN